MPAHLLLAILVAVVFPLIVAVGMMRAIHNLGR